MSDEFKSAWAMAEAERRRVQALIKRDREDEARDKAREQARIQVKNGDFTRFADTAQEPTPEWMMKGENRPFTPKQPDGTVRALKTVRRVVTPIVERMVFSGRLSEDHRDACLWYRGRHDLAGLDGRWASSQWNPTSTIRRGAVDAGFGYVPSSEAIAQARDEFRAARDAIQSFYLRFFDAVVIDDIPLTRASRFAKCRQDRAPHRFRSCCNELIDFLAKNRIVVKSAYEEGE